MKQWKKAIFPVLATGFITLGLISPASAQMFVNPYIGTYSGSYGGWYDYDRDYYSPYVSDRHLRRHQYWSPSVGWYGNDYWYDRNRRWDASDTHRMVGTILDYVF